MDENNSTTKCLENERVLHKIFQYLDCNNLRQAENVCTLWGKVITEQCLWEKLYHQNMEFSPEWEIVHNILKARGEVQTHTMPPESDPDFYKIVCCLTSDTIDNLKRNWVLGSYSTTFHTLNGPPVYFSTKTDSKEVNTPPQIFLSRRWILRAKPDGRIGVRSRWALEEEHDAELVPDASIGLDNEDNHPFFYSVQCFGKTIVAAGLANKRLALVFFNVKRLEMPLLLKVAACRWITTDPPFDYNPKNCFRVHSSGVLLCGSNTKNNATVVTVIKSKTKKTVIKNEEIIRCGTLVDFAIDDHFIVLFFGAKDNPRTKWMDRYRVQIRSCITCELLRTFTVPVVRSETCHFSYWNGLVVTGSDDSPIRLWNIEEGTCVASFKHGGNLGALRVVPEQLIISSSREGVVKIWKLDAVLLPENFEAEPEQVLLNTITTGVSQSAFPHKRVRLLDIKVDESQIAMSLQFDSKSPHLCVMDFLTGEDDSDDDVDDGRLRKKQRRV